jgi:hypothetical protein
MKIQDMTIIVEQQGKELIREKGSASVTIGLYQGDERTVFQTGMDGQLNPEAVHCGIASFINELFRLTNDPEKTLQERQIHMNNLLTEIENHAILALNEPPYEGELVKKHGSYALTVLRGEEISHQSQVDSLFVAVINQREDKVLVRSSILSQDMSFQEAIRAISLMVRSLVRQMAKANNVDDLNEQLQMVSVVMFDVKTRVLEVFFQKLENNNEELDKEQSA